MFILVIFIIILGLLVYALCKVSDRGEEKIDKFF